MLSHLVPFFFSTISVHEAQAQEHRIEAVSLGEEAHTCEALPCFPVNGGDESHDLRIDPSFLDLLGGLGSVTSEFEMHQRGDYSIYSEITDTNVSWGQHALRWKWRMTSSDLPYYTPPSSAPSYEVEPSDYIWLNDLETTQFRQANHVVGDPDGSWTEHVFTSPMEAAVFAALAMDWWHSPSYINLKTTDATGQPFVSAVIERVVFTVNGTQGVGDLCGWQTIIGPQQLALSQACAANSLITLHEVEISRWSDLLYSPWGPSCGGNCFEQTVILSGAEFAAAYAQTALYENMVLVSDPPSASEAKAARALARTMGPALLLPTGDAGMMTEAEALPLLLERR
jgi:hypothetical protein